MAETQFRFLKWLWKKDLFCSSLLLQNGAHAILIDTAVREAFEPHFLPALNDIDGLKLMVINTHDHSDHVECNEPIRNTFPKTVFLQREQVREDSIVEWGGIRLRVIETPGHSHDSICLLEPESGTLFTGDSVQGIGTTLIGYPLWDDSAAMIRSMEKLLRMVKAGEIRRICAGHPFLPGDGSGMYDEKQSITLLEHSISIIRDYLASAKTLPEEISTEEACKLLLERHGASQDPDWRELALMQTSRLLAWRKTISL